MESQGNIISRSTLVEDSPIPLPLLLLLVLLNIYQLMINVLSSFFLLLYSPACACIRSPPLPSNSPFLLLILILPKNVFLCISL